MIDSDRVRCPASIVIDSNSLEGLIDSIYGDVNLISRNGMAEYFSIRIILAARNDNVAEINQLC